MGEVGLAWSGQTEKVPMPLLNDPNAQQTWYYCSDPVDYYPYLTKCKTGWLWVPGS